MILQTLTHTGQVMHDLDAFLRQMRRRTDAGQQQNVRGADRPAAQDHLTARAHRFGHAVLAKRDARRALAVEQHALGQRAGDHPQIGTPHRRVQIADRGRAAPSLARRGLLIADAFLLLAVEVMVAWETKFHRGVDERIAQRMVVAGIGHRQRAIGAVPVVIAARLMLGAFEVGQYVGGGPAGIAQLTPVVEVFVLAADVDHAVDRRRATEDAAARPVDRAVVGPGIGLGLEHPVHPLVGERLAVAERNVDPEIGVLATRFQQDHRRRGIFAQARRHHAAGGARADDDEIGFQ